MYIEWLTSIRLFFCQCCSCSCWLLLGATGRPSLWRAPLLLLPIEKSFSWRLLQSSGLHNPKSDNFMWPFLSSSKLSGLISLECISKLEYYIFFFLCARKQDHHKINIRFSWCNMTICSLSLPMNIIMFMNWLYS